MDEGRKKADFVRSPDSALSSVSTVPELLATLLPLADLGAMAAKKSRGLRKSGGETATMGGSEILGGKEGRKQ